MSNRLDDHDGGAEETTNPKMEFIHNVIAHPATKIAALIFIGFIAFLVGCVVAVLIIYTASPEFNPTGSCRAPPAFVNHFDNDLDGVLQSSKQTAPLLVRNVNILDGSGSELSAQDILIVNGKISQIAPTGTISSEGTIVEGQGRYVTAGLVDMHSHLGVYSSPGLRANSDGNEMAQTPAAQMMRAIDALNPMDPSIRQMREGGVTTALVMPGSGNVIGGEIVLVKTKGGTVSNMIVRGAPRGLKMACGENPKRVYGSRGMFPASRMGNAWVMRSQFEAARALKQQQEEWDCNAENKEKSARKYRPSNLALEPLVGLLRGENVILNVHCYEVEDLEMMIRLSKEFKFKINAFHHALEAYKIPELIAKYNITVATFPDLWGYKVEAYDASVNAAKILRSYNVPVAFKSDHPVLHAKDLLFHATKGFYYGLDAAATIDSITGVPARAIGLGKRVGSVAVGYDGDVVVWDRHPLLLGATPFRVVVEGVVSNTQGSTTKKEGKPTRNAAALSVTGGTCTGEKTIANYAIQNAKVYTMDQTNSVLNGATIVVTGGNVTCVGTCQIPAGFEIYSQAGGVVIPGLIESSTQLGLVEIQAEVETGDGYSAGFVAGQPVFAKDGIRVQSRTVTAAWRGGVTTSVSHRTSSSVIGGVSSAFYTNGVVVSDSLVQSTSAIQVNLGSEAASDITSVSAQIAYIRTQLQRAQTQITEVNSADPWVQLIQNKIPMVALAHQADDIGHLLELQATFTFKLIIVGGAEAHLVADRLQRQLVSVVLTPYAEGNEPMQLWSTLRTANDFYAEKLRQAGVRIAVGTGSLYDARNLRWIAGLISSVGAGSVPEIDAIAAVTKNVADMFELNRAAPGTGRIQVGTRANFVLFDGHPLTFEGRPKVVAVGTTVECNPTQF